MNETQIQLMSGGAIMLRSLEHLLRKLIRMLVGRISLKRLNEIIQVIYVQETERQLKRKNPNQKVSLSQLALMSGMDTRTLSKLISSNAYEQPVHENNEFLKEMTSETRLLSVWMNDRRYFDQETKRPKALSLTPGPGSMYELAAHALGTRGLTIQSIVHRLESAGSVDVDRESQMVTLLTETYYPFLSDDEAGMLDVGFSTAASFLTTVATNLDRANSDEQKLFQRSTFTHQLSVENQKKFRQLLHEFLEKANNKCRSIIAEVEDAETRPGQITAGVSMFYFEETMPSPQ